MSSSTRKLLPAIFVVLFAVLAATAVVLRQEYVVGGYMMALAGALAFAVVRDSR